MQKNTSTDKATKKLSYAELSAFCEQLALLVGSGITLLEGFYALQNEADDGHNKALYSDIISHMEEGFSLSDTLDKVGVFPFYMIQMVKIGEVSGRLEDVFRSLAVYYNREDNLRKFIKHSVAYPLAMVAMMIVVIGVLVVEVMPIFNSVFIQLGGEMSGFSGALLDIGLWVSDNSIGLLIALLLLVAVALMAVFLPQGRKITKNMSENFILTKKLFYTVAVARFAGGMSLMLSSGLDTEESLRMVQGLVENKHLAQKIADVRQDIEQGKTFSGAMAERSVFTGIYSHMLSVGVSTGNVDEVMRRLSERYDNEVSRRFESIVAVIEPSIVAVLSIIIGGILLSVMLPLMSIISQMG